MMSVIAGYRATIAANPDRYVLVSSVDDIIRPQPTAASPSASI
jgi:membrane dipeptidase